MARRKRQLTTRGRLIILGPVCFFLMVCFVFSIFSYITNLYHLQQHKSKLELEYLELQEMADDLKVEITKLQDPEYLAKYARENYLYSKEGELIIKINEHVEEVATQEEKIYWNEKMVFVSLVVMSSIFLYIWFKGIKKKKSA